MFQSGSQINPALGRTDYSAYTQGAAQGAAAIGQGMQQLGQGIGAAIKDYNIKKEEKKLNEAAKAELKKLAIANPEIAKQFNITDVNDDKQYEAGVKVYGPRGVLQVAQGIKQDQEGKAKNERIGSLARAFVNKTEVPQDFLANMKGDEVMAAQGMAQGYFSNKANIEKLEAETNAINAGKTEKPSEFGIAYNAFKKANPNATAQQEQDFVYKYKQSGSPTTNVNMGENSAEKAIGEEAGAIYNAIGSAADSAEGSQQRLDLAKKLYAQGATSGAGAGFIGFAKNVLASAGIDVPSEASQAQLEQMLKSGALARTKELYKGMGSLSNLEGKNAEGTVANLSRTEKGNIQILEWEAANAPMLRAADDLKLKLRSEKMPIEKINAEVKSFVRKNYHKIDDFSAESKKNNSDESTVYDIVTKGKTQAPSQNPVFSMGAIAAERERRLKLKNANQVNQ